MQMTAMRKKGSLRAILGVKAIVAYALRVSALLVLILTAGFFVFAHGVSVMPSAPLHVADGIVALTGGEDRIAEAVRLLSSGKARRLLISGVNPTTTKPELISFNAVPRRDAILFRCCVDLDKRALNTEANAAETTAWVRQNRFRSLIVVTSSYHMPRSLVELRQAMPDVELIPYPVRSPNLEARWWSDQRTLWVLSKEYVKFVTALARYAAHSLASESGKSESIDRTVDAHMG